MHVTNLKARALTRQTPGTQCRYPALVGDLRKRVRLIQKLRQLARTEKRVDHRRQSPRIDQVNRRKHLVVPHIHPLPNRPRHTRQTDTKLSVQLLPYRSHTPVTQVIDIVEFRLLVDQTHQVAHDGDDVFFRQHLVFQICLQPQLAVDLIPAHLSEVVPLIREKQFFDNTASRLLIGGIGAPQLTVNVLHRFEFRTRRILVQRVVYDRVILFDILLLQNDCVHLCIGDKLNVLLIEDHIALQDDFIPLDGHHLAGVLVHKVFHPLAQDARRQLPADGLFQLVLRCFDLFRQPENVQDIAVRVVADGAQQRRHREFLFAVDVRVHHRVDIRCKLHPGTLKRDYPCRVDFRPVRVKTLAEEYPRRPVQLRYDHALSPVDDEGPFRGHIWNIAQEHILHNCLKIDVLLIITRQPKLRLQRHAVGQSPLHTLVDGVPRRVNKVVQEFKHEDIPGISDGEILLKNAVQTFVSSVFRGCL